MVRVSLIDQVMDGGRLRGADARAGVEEVEGVSDTVADPEGAEDGEGMDIEQRSSAPKP